MIGSLERFQRDAFLMLAAQSIYRVSGFVLLMAVSRRLTAGEIGIYSFADSFAGSLILVASLNQSPVMMRRVAGDPQHASDHLAPLLGFRLVSGLVVLLLMAVSSPFLPSNVRGVIWIAALAALLENGYFAFASFFLAMRRVSINVSIGMFSEVVFLVAALTVLWLAPSPGMLLAAGVFRSACLLGTALYATRRYFCRPRLAWDPAFLREGRPFFLITLFAFLRQEAETLMLGFLGNVGGLGAYYLSNRLVTAALFVPGAVGVTFFPHLVAEGLTPANRQRVVRVASLLGSAGLAGAVFLCNAAEPLAHLMYGPQANNVSPLLRLLIFVLPLLFVEGFLCSTLQALYHERAVVKIGALGAATTVAANCLLVPRLGAVGAVAAQLIAATLRTLAAVWFTRVALTKPGELTPCPS